MQRREFITLLGGAGRDNGSLREDYVGLQGNQLLRKCLVLTCAYVAGGCEAIVDLNVAPLLPSAFCQSLSKSYQTRLGFCVADLYRNDFADELAEVLQDNLPEGQEKDFAQTLAHQCAEN